MAEHRKFYRLPMDHVVEFTEYDFTTEKKPINTSKLKNVSGGGVLFRSDHIVPIGSFIKIKMNIPGWEKYKTAFIKPDWTSVTEPLVTLGSVVRVEEIEPGNGYDIGIVFKCIDENHRDALMKYLEELQSDDEK